jgi:type IV pilus assembly protein PilC
MGLYKYEATDKSGSVLRGVLQARDEQQLAVMLSNRGLTLLAAYPPGAASAASTSVSRPTGTAQPVVPTATHTSGPGIASVTVDGLPVSIKSCVSARQLAAYFRQYATLLRAGIPAFQAMQDMTTTTHDRKLKFATEQMSSMLHEGEKLSSAMAQFPGIFPVHAIASVWCGEMVGRIDLAMDEVAWEYEKEIKEYFVGKLGWFLAKSQLVTLVSAIPLLDTNRLLLPVLQEAAAAGRMTPDVGAVLKSLALTYIRNVLPMTLLLTAIVLGFWIALGFVKRLPVVKRLTDRLVGGFPLWGKLHQYRGLARFLTIMERLTAAGIPARQAWEAASLTPRSSEVAHRLRDAIRTSPGGSMVEMMKASQAFELEDVGTADAGEKSGSLPEMLGNLAQMYQSRADGQAGRGRFISIVILSNWLLITSGAIMIYLVQTYFSVLFKAGDIIQQSL